jgi:DNA repair exonuclease SbcCD ATPase subunit
MNIVHSIGLKGVSPFKEVQFKVPQGISVIYGLNRASGKASKNSNGVGKSYLMSTPAEIIYEEPVVGEKKDATKRGVRAFSFTNAHGKRVLVKRTARGRSDKLEISVDGEPKQFRTPTYAKAYLRKAWPITQEEYNTYVHIDSRVAHPLVMGTSAQRKAFFTSFFRLDTIDAERKLYVAELNRLMKVKAAFDELRAAYTKAKDDLLSDDTYIKYRSRRKLLKTELRDLQIEFERVQETVRLVAFARSAKDQIAKLARICGGPITEEEFERLEKANAWEMKKVAADIEDAEAWEQYQRDNAHYIKAFDRLPEKTRELLKERGMKALLAETKSATRRHRELAAEVELLATSIEDLEHQVTRLKDATAERPNRPEGNVADMKVALAAYQHQLDHAEQFKEGRCETCGQMVKIKNPKVLRERIAALTQQINDHREWQDWVAARRELKDVRTRLDTELKVRQKKANRVMAKVADLAVHYDHLKDLPSKPRPFEGKKLQLVVLRRMMDELRDNRALLDFMRPHLDTVIEVQQLTKADVKKAEVATSLTDKMNMVQDRLAQIQAKLEIHDTMRTRVLEMRDRLIEMKRELKDIEPLKILVQGFQDKNLKKMAIEAIGQRLMGMVNKIALPVFPENFTFEFKWDTQIQLIVHRKNGEPSDVRRLSGAESTIFTLVLVGALLAFVPSNKRCSMLILDEPSARMHPETTELFKKVLAVLNKIIPSIVVITPRSQEVYDGARAFTVVKDHKGVARLVDGYPHQVAVKH